MSEKIHESLSALMDDEANELELERVLSNIQNDPELRQTWSRFNVVRSVARGQATGFHEFDVSSRVREAIRDDKTVRPSITERFMRPVASLAVAASVTAVVVLGGQQMAQLDAGTIDSPGIASSVSPVGMVNSLGATSVPATYGTQSLPQLQPATRTAYQELARQRLQKYMQEHAEQTALNTPTGLVPYARVPRIQE
ncbi:MAG: sigma-E factor negative regulatory protein [Pseudomonadota bacterium]